MFEYFHQLLHCEQGYTTPSGQTRKFPAILGEFGSYMNNSADSCFSSGCIVGEGDVRCRPFVLQPRKSDCGSHLSLLALLLLPLRSGQETRLAWSFSRRPGCITNCTLLQALWSIAAYVTNTGGGNDGLHAPLAGWWWWCWNANSGDTGGIVRCALTVRTPAGLQSVRHTNLSPVDGLCSPATLTGLRTVTQNLTTSHVAGGGGGQSSAHAPES